MAPHALTPVDYVAILAAALAGLLTIAVAALRILITLIRRLRSILLVNAVALLAGLLGIGFAVFELGVYAAWDGTTRSPSFWSSAARVVVAALLISACGLLLHRGRPPRQARIRVQDV